MKTPIPWIELIYAAAFLGLFGWLGWIFFSY